MSADGAILLSSDADPRSPEPADDRVTVGVIVAFALLIFVFARFASRLDLPERLEMASEEFRLPHPSGVSRGINWTRPGFEVTLIEAASPRPTKEGPTFRIRWDRMVGERWVEEALITREAFTAVKVEAQRRGFRTARSDPPGAAGGRVTITRGNSGRDRPPPFPAP